LRVLLADEVAPAVGICSTYCETADESAEVPADAVGVPWPVADGTDSTY
jgi:hypothetical protein